LSFKGRRVNCKFISKILVEKAISALNAIEKQNLNVKTAAMAVRKHERERKERLQQRQWRKAKGGLQCSH